MKDGLQEENFIIKGSKKKQLGSAFLIALCLIVGIIGGFGGSFLYNLVSENTNSLISPSICSSQDNSEILPTDKVVEKVADSVVDVSVQSSNRQFGGNAYSVMSAGSGVVYSKDGYIITNNHVVKEASKIIVTLKNENKYVANIVGTDADNDVAVLKIDANNLSPVEIEDYSKVKLGEETIVIGNPLGELSGTITDGVVSALNRAVTVDGKKMNLMQTCAEINEGNSGGGVFDREGKLIGIVIAKTAGNEVEGLGFAIPVNTVEKSVKNIINN